LVALLFSFAIISFLLLRASEGLQYLRTTDVTIAPGYILLAVLCQIIGVWLAVVVWGRILGHLGVHATYAFNLQVFGVSALARKLPGTVWYAISRVVLYERRQFPRWGIIIAMTIELVSLSVGGLVVFCIGLATGMFDLPLLPFWLQYSSLWFGGILGLLVVVILLQPFLVQIFVRRTQHSVEYSPDITYFHTLTWLAGETTVITLAAGVIFFVAKAIVPETPIPFLPILGAFGLAVATGPLLIWLPGDIGVKDGLLYLVLSSVVSAPIAAIVVLVWRLGVTAMDILLGIICGITVGYERLLVEKSDLQSTQSGI
jgi:glycosyltransferase 2 family protein